MGLYEQFECNLQGLLINTVQEKSLAVAVSGGADSVALLVLCHQWVKTHQVKLQVMIVNHHLRTQSKIETEYVLSLAAQYNYSCVALNWYAHGDFTNLQARARQGRYALMSNMCHKLDTLTLLTAHHADDMTENFCMQHRKKSNVFGLCSSAMNFYNNVRILRPLFNVSKQQLVDFLTILNISWFEDESNYSLKYERNKIRADLAQRSVDEVRKLNLIQIKINLLAKPRTKAFIKALAETVAIYPYGVAVVSLNGLLNFEYDIKVHVIHYVLTIIGGKARVPRARSTSVIIDMMSLDIDFKRTVHGCVICKKSYTLFVYKEFSSYPAPQDVRCVHGAVWDNRFTINVKATSCDLEDAYITALTVEDFSIIKPYVDLKYLANVVSNLHKQILFTLPVIKIFEKVIALPHIYYYANASLVDKLCFAFRPNFVSRFTHFC